MMERLKHESLNMNNYYGLGEYSDMLTPYEHLIRFCEDKYGKIETWKYIERLIIESEPVIQLMLIKCCAIRYDLDTDLFRRNMLIDIFCDGKIHDCNLIRTLNWINNGFYENLEIREIDTWKYILHKLDQKTKNYVFQYLSARIIAEDARCKDHKIAIILNDITGTCGWDNYEDIKDRMIKTTQKEFNKQDIFNALKYMQKHKYATDEIKNNIRIILNSVMLE